LTQTDVPKLFAGCSGLAAFAIAILAGLAADNTADTILVRAVVSMAACFFLGSLLGLAAEAAIRESLRPRADIPATPSREPDLTETPPDGQKI
jgi:hypothetical protein